jgi:hypothetical protein
MCHSVYVLSAVAKCRRFYLTCDGSVYKDEYDCQYVTDGNAKVQHYAECTAAARRPQQQQQTGPAQHGPNCPFCKYLPHWVLSPCL